MALPVCRLLFRAKDLLARRQYHLLSRCVQVNTTTNSLRPHYVPQCVSFPLVKFFHNTYSLCDKKQSPGLIDQLIAAEKAKAEEEKSKSEDEKQKKEMPKWQKYAYLFFGVTFTGSIVLNGVLFALPDRDAQGNDIEDEFSSLPFPTQHYRRLKNKIFVTKKAIEEPFSDKLLPDPLEAPMFQPKYTVILEVTGTLVKSDWTHKHGWRFQKRPGLDIFMNQMGYPNFELVIWTVENGMTFYEIINGMDPNNQHIMYRLFRDATKFKNGMHVKELGCLNRDLKKVIVVDWNKNTTQDNPDNALTLPKWEGDMNDRSLFGLAQFLHEIKDSDVDDVREVLQYYRQFDDPIEAFRENQRKLHENLKLDEERQAKEKETSRFSPTSFSGFSSRFRR